MKVFLTIDPIEQIQRIEKRNGSEKAVEFQKKWIPLEELYFEKMPHQKPVRRLFYNV